MPFHMSGLASTDYSVLVFSHFSPVLMRLIGARMAIPDSGVNGLCDFAPLLKEYTEG
jgi:hypothetical protein